MEVHDLSLIVGLDPVAHFLLQNVDLALGDSSFDRSRTKFHLRRLSIIWANTLCGALLSR